MYFRATLLAPTWRHGPNLSIASTSDVQPKPASTVSPRITKPQCVCRDDFSPSCRSAISAVSCNSTTSTAHAGQSYRTCLDHGTRVHSSPQPFDHPRHHEQIPALFTTIVEKHTMNPRDRDSPAWRPLFPPPKKCSAVRRHQQDR